MRRHTRPNGEGGDGRVYGRERSRTTAQKHTGIWARGGGARGGEGLGFMWVCGKDMEEEDEQGEEEQEGWKLHILAHKVLLQRSEQALVLCHGNAQRRVRVQKPPKELGHSRNVNTRLCEWMGGFGE